MNGEEGKRETLTTSGAMVLFLVDVEPALNKHDLEKN